MRIANFCQSALLEAMLIADEIIGTTVHKHNNMTTLHDMGALWGGLRGDILCGVLEIVSTYLTSHPQAFVRLLLFYVVNEAKFLLL